MASKNVESQKSELDILKQKVYAENTATAELDTAIKTTNSEIIDLKRKQGGTAASNGNERATTLSKQAKLIENRVDKANIRYSEALTQNTALRE